MSDKTGIEWTDATWNPVTGCTEVSPGCDHCYAKTFAERFRSTEGHYFEHGFDVQLRPDKLEQPLRWRKPRKVFVNSMSDLFHDSVPNSYIAEVFAVMAAAPQHTFQVLTKRHGRMRTLLSSDRFQGAVEHAMLDQHGILDNEWPLPNVWLGVSAENQQWADIRIPALLGTPAAVRFISAEPLLGPLDLLGNGYLSPDEFDRPGIEWVIVGGESGRGARPMHPFWVDQLQQQCEATRTAFLFKQWGEWRGHLTQSDGYPEPNGYVNRETGELADEQTALSSGGDWTAVWRFGKKAAGRELHGRTWDEYPEVVSA